MQRCLLEVADEEGMEILPSDDGRGLFEAFVQRCPGSVELMHVKWSGDALFFVLDLGVDLDPSKEVDEFRPGQVSYYPELNEVIIPYGLARPRSEKGDISVHPLGCIAEVDRLCRLGGRVWREGATQGRIRRV